EGKRAMTLINTFVRRGLAGTVAAAALGAVVAGTVAVPTAGADPCTASGLSTTASGVLSAAGGYLDAHPGANDVLTAAGTQPADEARSSVRGYFTAHPGEFLDLQAIARPLSDLKNQCGISVSPGQLALLFDEIA
ncbi:MAG: heme-binding protein, partial [Mycobacterium sp.]|nr:heme-binding protein [Mycobacterium sp.]